MHRTESEMMWDFMVGFFAILFGLVFGAILRYPRAFVLMPKGIVRIAKGREAAKNYKP